VINELGRESYKKAMRIKCKAMCVFRNKGSILVQKEADKYNNAIFYRPLGGAIEFGEKSQETVIREIKEEISADITGIRFLGVLENVFVYEREQCHEIVFIYDARFREEELYDKEEIRGEEVDGQEIIGMWKKIGYFEEENRLVPEGLINLLAK
jgi:8-oxo-dGTP pyrophosphatase MutT (NUDIX family)